MLPEGNQLTVNHSQPFTNASNPAPRPGCSGFQVAMNQSESVSYLLDQVYKLGAVGGGPLLTTKIAEKCNILGTELWYWLAVWNMAFMTFHILGRIIPI